MEGFNSDTILGMSVTGVIVIIIGILVNKIVNTPVESYYSDPEENSKA